MKRLTTVLIGCLLITITAGSEMAVAQRGYHMSPGMAAIVGKARSTALLQQIRRGKTPATIEEYLIMRDPTGLIGTYQPGGSTTTAGNGFFSTDITNNGRTCFTCH